MTPVARIARGVRNARDLAAPRTVARLGGSWVRAFAARKAYPETSEAELLAARPSDTAFIFGSGRSLLDISRDEWASIGEHATIGFSEFVRAQFVRVDYHMIGEISGVDRYAGLIRANPEYAQTIFLVQRGWRADDSNEIVGRRLLPEGARVFFYRRTSRAAYAPPSRSFPDGLVHGWNSSISATNLALLLGCTRIVLTGVDLYNKEYFWLEPGERRETLADSLTPASAFPMADLVIDLFARWRALLEPEGIELLVYNPRSLLAGVLDVFEWQR